MDALLSGRASASDCGGLKETLAAVVAEAAAHLGQAVAGGEEVPGGDDAMDDEIAGVPPQWVEDLAAARRVLVEIAAGRATAMTDDAGHLAVAGPWSGPRLDRLADAFGNPVRRDVFMLLRTRSAPMVATDVAKRLGLQRTAARAHLERLVDLGLVSSSTRRTASGGLPTKSYAAVEARLEVTVPPRRYEALAGSLLELLGAAGVEAPAEHAAVVGRALRRAYCAEVSSASASRGR